MLADAAIQQLKKDLLGELVRPDDSAYDTARKVWNGMIDKRPALIVRCLGTSDVIAGVRFAREHGLAAAVRGGGHNIAGKCVCDDGVLFDFSLMEGIHVDPLRRTARAQAGLKLGGFDRETQVFGLATTMGIASDTGVAGLTLGGGYGWLGGMYGLACDNLISAQVVNGGGESCSGQPRRESRSVLGAPRWQREFRHRHFASIIALFPRVFEHMP